MPRNGCPAPATCGPARTTCCGYTPRVARRYRNLLLDTGFSDVAVEAHTGIFTDATMLPMLSGFAHTAHQVGAITSSQAESWTAEQSLRATNGRLFLAVPLFLASATRP